jgi:hypothetical protein
MYKSMDRNTTIADINIEENITPDVERMNVESCTELEVMLETIVLSLILPVTIAVTQYFCS